MRCEQYEKGDDQMRLFDNIRYAPSREQWEQAKEEKRGQWHFRGTYRIRRFYSLFGITSPLWDDLVRENKRDA